MASLKMLRVILRGKAGLLEVNFLLEILGGCSDCSPYSV